jgi:hypothetical protein
MNGMTMNEKKVGNKLKNYDEKNKCVAFFPLLVFAARGFRNNKYPIQ